MSFKNTSRGSLASQLSIMMGLTERSEEEEYKSHFEENKEMWSLEAFVSILNGLSLRRYEKLKAEATSGQLSPSDLRRLDRITDCLEKFFQTHDGDFTGHHFAAETLWLSAWRYIKWIALNNIPLTKKFLESLPLHLAELYLEFQSGNVALREQSRFSTEYHRAVYLKHAKQLISREGRRLTRKEIYNHPLMKNVMRSFRDHAERPRNYKSRTVIESWLRAIDPRPRGRPKKSPPSSRSSA